MLSKKFPGVGLEVNELFVEFSALPMRGIPGLEENPLNAVPVYAFEFDATDGARARDLDNGCLSGQRIEREFMQPLAALDHVEWSVDVSSCMGTHRDGGQADDMSFVSRFVRLLEQLNRRITRPYRHRVCDRDGDVVDHESFVPSCSRFLFPACRCMLSAS